MKLDVYSVFQVDYNEHRTEGKEAHHMANKSVQEFEVDPDESEMDEVEATAPNEYHGIMITATPEFKAALKAAAETEDMSLSAFSRQILATHIGFQGPLQKETRRVRKYATQEEREAAQKSRNKARRDVIKQLLEKYGADVKAQIDEAVANS